MTATILIVEDEADLARTACATTSKPRASAWSTAESGDEAVERIRDGVPGPRSCSTGCCRACAASNSAAAGARAKKPRARRSS